MKNLEIILKECLKECDQTGIKYGRIEKIDINKRLKSTWGRCTKRIIKGKEVFFIEINSVLLEDDISDKAIKNTVMHEILHTVEGCHNHSRTWKYYAEIINSKNPHFNIKRITSCEEKGIEKKEIKYKYFYKCKKCGQLVKRQRSSEFIKKYTCGLCGGVFIKIQF